MKRKLLFVIDSLNIGGAEKSLISLLNLIDSSKYKIDLLVLKRGGDFERYVPESVNILPVPAYFSYISGERFPRHESLVYFYYRMKTSLKLRLNNYKQKKLHGEQIVFKSIDRIISPIQKKYDVAIAYSQGMPTYIVANKVVASKKLAWINTDYANTLYDKVVDYEYYKKIDKMIAVSLNTKNSLEDLRTEYNAKTELMLDIIDPNIIYEMTEEYEVEEFDSSVINIVTVGRLVTAKSYSTAIEVAKLLKEADYKFRWFGIGEGPERERLQEFIDKYQLNDCFILLGKKINPYPYMRNCDIYVQTSIKEGFGLTVCEAKILKKPIVCTNFFTAREIINHNVDGLIVEHDVKSIYQGIKKYIDHTDFKKKIVKELNCTESYNSVNQLNKFYELVNN